VLRLSLTAEWEAAAANVPKSTRVVIIRTGIVLARDGGVLARMLPIFELFAGGWVW
jgi:NAD dependent epimerase/dehydratase family enzyme